MFCFLPHWENFGQHFEKIANSFSHFWNQFSQKFWVSQKAKTLQPCFGNPNMLPLPADKVPSPETLHPTSHSSFHQFFKSAITTITSHCHKKQIHLCQKENPQMPVPVWAADSKRWMWQETIKWTSFIKQWTADPFYWWEQWVWCWWISLNPVILTVAQIDSWTFASVGRDVENWK